MSYLHIPNLYRPEGQHILLFKEAWALEKIHGTSTHLTFKVDQAGNRKLLFSSGGVKNHNTFVKLFDAEKLLELCNEMGIPADRDVIVYGEAYGGSQQGMSATYGKDLKFIAFDVQIGDVWLDVPNAHDVSKKLGLEFVDYVKIPTTLEAMNAERDKPSVQAVRNGITEPRPREGVVFRPLIEVTLNNGNRVICKHKGEEFQETATPRKVVDPEFLKVLEDAKQVAAEWVTLERLRHVLDKHPGHSLKMMGTIIQSMLEDVVREGEGEIIWSKAVSKEIGCHTVNLYKQFLKEKKDQQ